MRDPWLDARAALARRWHTGNPNVHIGEVIDGKYVVERKLGQGGMGTVVAARHQLLGAPVAIKLLTSDSPERARRFMREARNASKLRGPHMTQVLHVGRHRDQPYMVLEYVEGVDLGTMLDQGKLAPHLACGYIVQACEGLAEAHALGMVHRDIKPSNLMLTHGGVVKLLDFGIATAATGDQDMLVTSQNEVLGSPHYMSPEQLRSTHDVDARTDVWSLGVTLYELLSNRQPFEGRTFAAITIAVVTEPHEPLHEASSELAAIIDRCLAKSAADRFQSVGELAAALAPFAQDRSLGLPAYLAARPRAAEGRALTDVLSSFTGTTRISPADHQRAIVPQPAPWVPPVQVFPQDLSAPKVRPQCALPIAWADEPVELPPSTYPPAQALAWHPESELDGAEHTSIEVEITSLTRPAMRTTNGEAVSQLELVDGNGDRVLVPPAARGSATQVHAAPPAGVQVRPPSQPGQSYRDADAWSMSCTGDDVGISNLAWSDLEWEDRAGKATWSGTSDARPTQDEVARPTNTATVAHVEAGFDPNRPSVMQHAPSPVVVAQHVPSPVHAATVAQHAPSPVAHAATMPLGKSPRLGRVITGDSALAESPAPRPTPSEWAAATPAQPQLRYARRASAHPIVAPLASQPTRPPVATVHPARPPVATVHPARRPPPLPPLTRTPRATPNPATSNPTLILAPATDPVLLARLAPTAPVPAQPEPEPLPPAPEVDAASTIPSILARHVSNELVTPKPLTSVNPAAESLPLWSVKPAVASLKSMRPAEPLTPAAVLLKPEPLKSMKPAAASKRETPDPDDNVAARPILESKSGHAATLLEQPPVIAAKTRAPSDSGERRRSIVDGDITPPSSFSQRTYLNQSLVPPTRTRTPSSMPEIRAPQSSLALLPVIPAMSARLVETPPRATTDLAGASMSLSTAPRARTIGIAAAIATVAVLAIVWFATRSEDAAATAATATAATAVPAQRAATAVTAPPRTAAPPVRSAAHETAHVRTLHVPVPPSAPSVRRSTRSAKKAAVPCRPQDPACGL